MPSVQYRNRMGVAIGGQPVGLVYDPFSNRALVRAGTQVDPSTSRPLVSHL